MCANIMQLFNDFADQAGYYDVCLLIYHVADFRNASTIQVTWTNLIQQVHDELAAQHEAAEAAGPGAQIPPMPYEAVATKINYIAHRVSLDSFVFPIQTLLPELCRYAVAYQQDATIGADPTWPIGLFLKLRVSHDMIVRVLENIFDTQDYGFSGSVRNRVIELIVSAVRDWVDEVRRTGGISKGSAIGPSINDLLSRCESAMPAPGRGRNDGGRDLSDVRMDLRALRREVAALVDRVPAGSMRFA